VRFKKKTVSIEVILCVCEFCYGLFHSNEISPWIANHSHVVVFNGILLKQTIF
jgi:hypothetical protein